MEAKTNEKGKAQWKVEEEKIHHQSLCFKAGRASPNYLS